MSLQSFQVYQLALNFHQLCRAAVIPADLRDQLLRASASVALNLAEGSAKPTKRDQRRYYFIAMGSLRESQAALELSANDDQVLHQLADRIGGCLYKLCRSAG